MLTTVKLHGWLGKKYGKTFKMQVSTTAQAVGLLRANFKNFASDVINYNPGYRVHVGKEVIDATELANTTGGKTIHIIPVIAGSNNVARIVVGAILIYAALTIPGLQGAAGVGLNTMGQAVFSFGTSLVIGGVMGLLTPTAKPAAFSAESADNRPSYMFNGPVNTVGQGNPVSVLYGQLLVGSQVISAGLATTQLL